MELKFKNLPLSVFTYEAKTVLIFLRGKLQSRNYGKIPEFLVRMVIVFVLTRLFSDVLATRRPN